MSPLISVCIPAFNRAELLPALLDSILAQEYQGYEIVVCEDMSPERLEIRNIVSAYSRRAPGRIRYFENDENLGYDANLRNLIEKANGDYCFFMGNDDLLCPGALGRTADAISRYANVGVVLRSYASFDTNPDVINQKFVYFPEEQLFRAGAKTVRTVYRRSVVISGMVVRTDRAREYSSKKFDGTLLYQLYLVANILLDLDCVYLPQIMVLYRNGGVPDFGTSENEKATYVPGQQTPKSSLAFVAGMLDIARSVELERNVDIYKAIVRDLGNYSYPILAIQSNRPPGVYCGYAIKLARMGLGKSPLFYIYCLGLLVLGARRLDLLISYIKRKVGHTPRIGGIMKGDPH